MDTLPLTIEHQRIYLLPSGRGLAFIGALLLMLVASVNYALSLGYALCFVLTGMFCASLLHTYRNLTGLTVQSISTQDCFAGETALFTLTLTSQHDQLRYGLDISSADAHSSSVTIHGNRSTKVTLCVPARRRGRLSLGRLTLRSHWPLGLWTAWSYIHAPIACVVYPAPESNAPALPMRAGSVSSKTGNESTGNDPVNPAGLRDYIPGDKPGLIAWTSLARGMGLHSKHFTDETRPDQINLCLADTGLAELDLQLARLCAWVLMAEDTQLGYKIQLPGSSPEGSATVDSADTDDKRYALRQLALYGVSS